MRSPATGNDGRDSSAALGFCIKGSLQDYIFLIKLSCLLDDFVGDVYPQSIFTDSIPVIILV
jgi:hypothetical protein